MMSIILRLYIFCLFDSFVNFFEFDIWFVDGDCFIKRFFCYLYIYECYVFRLNIFEICIK